MKNSHFVFTDMGRNTSAASNDEARRANFWENETIFQQNKEVGSATKMPYRNEASMLADKNYYATPWN